MLKSIGMNEKLFTFGANQLSQQIKVQTKTKFPFRKNRNSKKLSVHNLQVSQQRQTSKKLISTPKETDNINLKNKLILCLQTNEHPISQISSYNQQNHHHNLHNIRYKSCEKKRGGLPDIFKMRSNSTKKKVISPGACLRYGKGVSQKNIRQFQIDIDDKMIMRCSEKQETPRSKRPQSMMYLSEDLGCDSMATKHRTIPQKKTIRGHNSKKLANIRQINLKGVNTRILENISELKKIYSS